MSDLMLLKLNEISAADDILQRQIREEKEAFLKRQKARAEEMSTFKKGDIVRAKIGSKLDDQAFMIFEIHSVSESEDDEDYTLTHYTVLAKDGRQFNLHHSEGSNPDADPDAVRLIKRA